MSNEVEVAPGKAYYEIPGNTHEGVIARIASSLRVPGVRTATLGNANSYPVFGSMIRVITTPEGMEWIRRINGHPSVAAASHLIDADLLEQYANLSVDDTDIPTSEEIRSEAARQRSLGLGVLQIADDSQLPIPEKLIGEIIEELLRPQQT